LIDLAIDEEQYKRTVKRCRDREIVIPTFAQLKDPTAIPVRIKEKLKNTGLRDVAPQNLFRITWKNEPTTRGGLFRSKNDDELIPDLWK
jgi:cysteine synthase A